MVRGLVGAGQAQHLRAKLSQVPLHLLLLRPLDVVLGWVFQMSLDLLVEREEKKSQERSVEKWEMRRKDQKNIYQWQEIYLYVIYISI